MIILSLSGCDGEEPIDEPDNQSAKIRISFSHLIDDQPIDFDTLKYVNEAGNPYMVNEIQYFISDVTLFRNDGFARIIDDWKDIHYVDTDLPATQTWEVYDKIEPGTYDSIAFTFGIVPEKNISFMFVNPPEKDMFWPEYLGGGYHYMKLNGKWLPEGQTVQTIPFDFHLGRGQVYFSYPDSITGFIDNQFNVSLPASGFHLNSGETKEIEMIMHVEKWFKDPHVYDHDVFGGYIMQNQEAMLMVKENGHNVFTVKIKD
ncbi:MAG: hypothetical protein KQI35_07750 [Bacteroidetes bacterium]|nr:hypothetical protein [Bacteroidota bacterium]